MVRLFILNCSGGGFEVEKATDSTMIPLEFTHETTAEKLIARAQKIQSGTWGTVVIWLVLPQDGNRQWELIEELKSVSDLPFHSVRIANGSRLDEVIPAAVFLPLTE